MLGQDPNYFWTLTLREIDIIIRGAVARQQRHHDELAWAAWHVARLTAYPPEKASDFIKLDDMLSKPQKQRKQPDWESDFLACQGWAKGTVKNG
jgi:hypothetical protein